MKNIQKLADEIFKAPTMDELANRMDPIEKAELRAILVDNPQISKVVDLFPKGAYWIDWYSKKNSVYNKFKKLIEESVGSWQQVAKNIKVLKEDDVIDVANRWLKAKTKSGKNVVKIMHGVEIDGEEVNSWKQDSDPIYIFEKL